MCKQHQPESSLPPFFEEKRRIDGMLRCLVHQGIPRDNIVIIGYNFRLKTKISGFISQRNIIFGGLRNAPILGVLFGSFFIFFFGGGMLSASALGAVVGSTLAVLLGATSGIFSGIAAIGVLSKFISLGLIEEHAIFYQSRLKPGELVVMIKTSNDHYGEYQAQESEERHVCTVDFLY
jgi:hypothetical protein